MSGIFATVRRYATVGRVPYFYFLVLFSLYHVLVSMRHHSIKNLPIRTFCISRNAPIVVFDFLDGALRKMRGGHCFHFHVLHSDFRHLPFAFVLPFSFEKRSNRSKQRYQIVFSKFRGTLGPINIGTKTQSHKNGKNAPNLVNLKRYFLVYCRFW